MSKTKVVLFQEGYARILTNPAAEDLEKLSEAGITYLVNPNLDAVKGISPEFWKLVGVNILPMSKEEQEVRSSDLGLLQPDEQIVIVREVIKEVEKRVEIPVEVIKEVEVEKLVEVEKIVKEPVFVTEYIEVPLEIEVIREVPVEVIKLVDNPVEVIKEVEKIVEVPVRVEVKQINVVTPNWAYWLIAVAILQTCYILLQGAINGR